MLIAICCLAFTAPSEIFVAKNGNDGNLGTGSKPVATIERALELARSSNIQKITIRKGEYQLTKTIELDKRDSMLLIQGEKGSRPLLTGAVQIPLIAIKPCNDPAILDRIIEPGARSQIKKIDLKPFLKEPLSPASPYGFTTPVSVGPNELFGDDKPLTVSRWPNTGFTTIASVEESGNGEKDRAAPPRKPIFIGASDRAKLWSKSDDLWLFGYWKFDWADESMRVESVEPQSGKITLSKPHSYGVEKGAQYFAENLIEELDQPGEYYLDRKNSVAYLVPPANIKTLRLSMLSTPLFVIKGGTGIRIENLDLAYSRGDGVQISNAEYGTVKGCQLFNFGERAVTIEGGYSCTVNTCNIWNTGEGGIALGGGDRKTLTSS
jgi:hypothetical protein